MKSRTTATILITALVSAGLTYVILGRSPGSSPAPAHNDEAEAAAHGGEESRIVIPGLRTAPVVETEGLDAIEVTGSVVVPPDRLVKISPRIEGKVVAAHGTVGDSVSRGRVLAVISSVELAEARSQYRQAAARLDAARRSYDREKQVVQLGAVSVRPLEEARSQSLSAQGDLADAKSELAQAKSEQAREESELTQCKARLERARELYADKIISKQDLESAEAEFKRDSATVESAKSKVAQAESRVRKAGDGADIAAQYLAREEKVYKGRVLDTRALQTAKAEVTSAEIELRAAADRIRVLGADPSGSGDTVAVTSPISGRIVSRDTNVGQMASPADALFTVANLAQVWIEADVYEKDLAKARKGQPAEIRVDAYPDRVFAGRVGSIGDLLSPESRTAKVRCAVPNPDGLLRGGMFAKVTLVAGHRGSAILIPRQAVLDEADGKVVFVPCTECRADTVAGKSTCGSFDKVEVTLGPARGDKVEVLKGLKHGARVVTAGAYQLKSALSSGKLEAGCAGGH